jgi:hypothetical protein
MCGREFRSLLLQMIRDHKKDSNKQENEVKKSMQVLDKKVHNILEKLSKEMEIVKITK